MNRCAKILFTVSVVLNVVLIGVIGGHFYMRWQENSWQEVRAEIAPESRNLVARTLQKSFRDIRAVGDQARKTRAEILKILSAEKFDEKAYDAQAKKLMEQRVKITAIKVKSTKELAKKLSPEDRANMAQRMTDMLGGGREKQVSRDHKPKELDKKSAQDDLQDQE
jgi:uncharacterized membrane protein